MTKQLESSRFRWINEQLYTTTGKEAAEMFSEDPNLFDIYHKGFNNQVRLWPVNPVDKIIEWLKKRYWIQWTVIYSSQWYLIFFYNTVQFSLAWSLWKLEWLVSIFAFLLWIKHLGHVALLYNTDKLYKVISLRLLFWSNANSSIPIY